MGATRVVVDVQSVVITQVRMLGYIGDARRLARTLGVAECRYLRGVVDQEGKAAFGVKVDAHQSEAWGTLAGHAPGR
jgi:hypothetical protein